MKSYKKPAIDDDMGGKKKKKPQGSQSLVSLDQNVMERGEYLIFRESDFKLSDNTDIEHRLLFFKVAALQMKTLVELPFLNFWSTLRFNPYLLRSLESLLLFGKQYKKGTLQMNAEEESVLNTIFRLVLAVFVRISGCENEDPHLTKDLNLFETVISGMWYLDSVKILDIIKIYGDSNSRLVKSLIKDYEAMVPVHYEIPTSINWLIDLLTQRMREYMKEIVNLKKREEMSIVATVDRQYLQSRELLLESVHDFSVNLTYFVEFFTPSYLENFLSNPMNFLNSVDNLYILIAQTKNWGREDVKFKKLIHEAKQNMVIFVGQVIMTVITHVITPHKVSEGKKSLFNSYFDIFLSRLGQQVFMINRKKEEGQRNFTFAAQLMEKYALGDVLGVLPRPQVPNLDIFLAQMESLKPGAPPVAVKAPEAPKRDRKKEKEDAKVETMKKARERSLPPSDNDEEGEQIMLKKTIKATGGHLEGDIEAVKKATREEARRADAEKEEAENRAILARVLEARANKKGKKSKNLPSIGMIGSVKGSRVNREVAEYEDEYDDTLELYKQESTAGVEIGDDEEDPHKENVIIEGETEDGDRNTANDSQMMKDKRGGERGGNRGGRGGDRGGNKGGNRGGDRDREGDYYEKGTGGGRYQDEHRGGGGQRGGRGGGKGDRGGDRDDRGGDEEESKGADKWRGQRPIGGGQGGADYRAAKAGGAEHHAAKNKNKREYYRKKRDQG